MQDPVMVYSAPTAAEAELVQLALRRSGIEASITAQAPQTGHVLAVVPPGAHLHQVWVDHSDAERATEYLEAYDRMKTAETELLVVGPDIEVVCEDCDGRSTFPASAKGNVEVCPHCGAHVDVGADDDDGDWGESEDKEE